MRARRFTVNFTPKFLNLTLGFSMTVTRTLDHEGGATCGLQPCSARMACRFRRATQRWLEEVVVRHGLCPFASPVLKRGGIRIVVPPGWLRADVSTCDSVDGFQRPGRGVTFIK